MENQVQQDKQWRKDLDATLQQIKAGGGSRERSLTITKLQEAIMWLGMDLKRINELAPEDEKRPNPYPQSYNPDSPRIEPTADGLKL